METKGELAKALAKAQSEMKEAEMDSTNPHYKSKFASLTSCWKACRDALNKNGLSISQGIQTKENGEHVLLTYLLHSSGEERFFEVPLLLGKKDMQGLGSAMTYARRYGLGAMVGLVTDSDDDGNDSKRPDIKPEEYSDTKPHTESLDENPPTKLKYTTYPFMWKIKDTEVGDIPILELHTMADKAKNIKEPSKSQAATLKAVKAAIKKLEAGEKPV